MCNAGSLDRTHRFNSRKDMQQTLQRYVALYNHKLPQSALGSKTPMQAMKEWYLTHPRLFLKRPYDRPGCDTYPTERCSSAKPHGRCTFTLKRSVIAAANSRLIPRQIPRGRANAPVRTVISPLLAGQFSIPRGCRASGRDLLERSIGSFDHLS